MMRFMKGISGCLCILIMLSAGCGKAEYERRLRSRGTGAVAATPGPGQPASPGASELYAALQLPGTGFSVCVPRVFVNPPFTSGSGDERRVQAGPARLPDLKFTYEAFVSDAAGGQMPYYLHLAATSGSGQAIAEQIRSELAGRGQQETGWADVPIASSTGRTLRWRRLRATGQQEFYYKTKEGQEQLTTMPGLLEIYLCESGGQVLIIAWRMPAAVEQHSGMARLAPLVAGSVSAP